MGSDNKMAAFAAAARRTIEGPRVDLSIGDQDGQPFWFCPKKYSIEGEREIQTTAARSSRKIPRKLRERLQEFLKEDGSVDMELASKELTEAEKDELENVDIGDAESTTELVALQLLHGIGRNNFAGEEQTGIDRAQVDVIMDYVGVADEIIEPVRRWNHPLPSGNPENSETS